MSIRNLIPPDAWKMLNREKDLGKLNEFGYLVVCDTCGVVFLETTLDVIRKEIKQGKWDKPLIWYVTAGRHWVTAHPNCLHEINCYLVYPSGTKAKVEINGRGLSEDWQRQLGDPDSENYNASKESLLDELQHLEQQLTP